MPFSPIVTLAALTGGAGEGAALGGTQGPDLTRYLVVSSALLLAVAGLAFGFRRLVGKSLVAKAARRSLQVMDVLPVGSRQRLAVVRCYDRTFLLGLGERELALITELDGVIAPPSPAPPGEADQRAFARLLQRARIEPAAPPASAAAAPSAPVPARPAPAPRPRAARQTAEWLG